MYLKSTLNNFKSRLVLFVSMISLASIFYITLNFYFSVSTEEIFSNWVTTNKVAIQEGSVLNSVSQSQRVLLSSGVIRGIYVFDLQRDVPRPLISYGHSVESFPIQLFGMKRDSIYGKRGLLFTADFFYKSSGTVPLVIAFSFDAPVFRALFFLATSLMLIFLFAAFKVFSKTEEVEYRKRVLFQLELARQVAHDIRAPTSVIAECVKTLNGVPSETFELLQSAAARINDVANELLARSKKNALPCNPFILLKKICDEQRRIFKAYPNIIWSCSLHATGYVSLKESERELSRVFSNLITNAVEALVEKSGEISISAVVTDSMMNISIDDSGRGIPVEFITKIFEKDFSYGKQGASNGGSGLGLYHAKNYIESINGRIRVASTSAEGTKIEILIPVDIITSAILIDDDPIVRKLWSISAKKKGIDFRAFSSLDEFIKSKEKFPKKTPIYLDVDLGVGSDIENNMSRIIALGFREIYISTGFSEHALPPLPSAKGILTKQPPWL